MLRCSLHLFSNRLCSVACCSRPANPVYRMEGEGQPAAIVLVAAGFFCPLINAWEPSMRVLSTLLAACLAWSWSAPLAGAEPAAVQVYQVARLYDGRSTELAPNQRLVVQGERIVAVGAVDEIELPDGAELIDLGEATLIPGLINSHLHLAAPPDRAYAEALLRRNLYAGVTAVRSMGDDVRALADLARAAQLAEIVAPDIGYAAFFAGPGFFHDRRLQASARGLNAGQIPWQRQIDDQTDLQEAVTLARGAGVTGIKIYANLSPKRAAQIVRIAHRQGLQAWAHGAVFRAS